MSQSVTQRLKTFNKEKRIQPSGGAGAKDSAQVGGLLLLLLLFIFWLFIFLLLFFLFLPFLLILILLTTRGCGISAR